MIIQIVLTMVSLVVLNIIIFLFEKFSSDRMLYNLTFLWVMGQALFPVWYFQGIERMKYITIVNVSSKLIFALLIFFVIHKESDYIYVPLMNGLGGLFGAAIALWVIYRTFGERIKLYSFKINKTTFY